MTSSEHAARRRYDALAEGYDDSYLDVRSRAENRHVQLLLRLLIRPSDRVVDLGCGTGLCLDLWPIAPDRYVGLDISPNMLARARAKHPAHVFVEGDIEAPNSGLPDGSADVVVSLFGSLSYCDLARSRDRVLALLRPGGRFLLMFCSPPWIARKIATSTVVAPFLAYSAAAIAAAYPGSRVWGLSRWIDALPDETPPVIADLALMAEALTAGRLDPDGCYFIVVEGRR